ncbi:hypothetical protein BDF21DRAFT_402674 [Thamnidium elegans]|nr:hypothetical protein BDF21DRAFT_402674 [Thamnidium elegans]
MTSFWLYIGILNFGAFSVVGLFVTAAVSGVLDTLVDVAIVIVELFDMLVLGTVGVSDTFGAILELRDLSRSPLGLWKDRVFTFVVLTPSMWRRRRSGHSKRLRNSNDVIFVDYFGTGYNRSLCCSTSG